MIARFRVWDKRWKRMSVDGMFDYAEGPTTLYISLSGVLFIDNFNRRIDMLHGEAKRRYAIMQSTGLKDIFGDDIVKFSLIEEQGYKSCTQPPIYIGVVKYNIASLGWMIECQTIKHKYPSGAVYMSQIIQDTVKVIGNLHANPELLEGE